MKEYLELVYRIEYYRFEISPYSPYRYSSYWYIISDTDTTHYSEYIHSSRGNCDFLLNLPSLGNWASIDHQYHKLHNEEEEAIVKIL